jgi:hypothetical protein
MWHIQVFQNLLQWTIFHHQNDELTVVWQIVCSPNKVKLVTGGVERTGGGVGGSGGVVKRRCSLKRQRCERKWGSGNFIENAKFMRRRCKRGRRTRVCTCGFTSCCLYTRSAGVWFTKISMELVLKISRMLG